MAEEARPDREDGDGSSRRKRSSAGGAAGWSGREPAVTDLRRGERLVFFTTAGRLTADGAHWLVPIHGRIFQPAHGRASKAALSLALKGFGVNPDALNRNLFDARCALLLGDNCEGRRVAVSVAGSDYVLPVTGRDGQFRGVVPVSADIVPAAVLPAVGRGPQRLDLLARLAARDGRQFRGYALLTQRTGLSVISDIDDTVKITHVGDRRRMLALTFLEPFEPVPGIAARFRQWSAAGAAFHFVSSSPWPLYEPLAEFLAHAGFPDATTTLKNVSLRDRSIRNFLANSTKTKPPAIDVLLAAFPGRRFVLVGDDVENDARIYADAVRRHPGRIARIFIRHVEGQRRAADKARRELSALDPSLWQLFTDAAELPERLA